MLRVRVSTASAEIIETELITAGRRGLECGFEFNSAWDGLAKTVIVNGVVKRDIVLVSDTITVPGECLAREQFPLRIGVYGANGAGEIVIPTIWANFGKILPSARPSGVDPDEVTPDLVAQINRNSSDALRLAQEVMRRADSGEFDGRDGTTGPAGPSGADGRDGAPGNSIWWAPTSARIVDAFVTLDRLSGRQSVPPQAGDLVFFEDYEVYKISIVGQYRAAIDRLGSIIGPKGDQGDAFTYEDFTEAQLAALTGPQGPVGPAGSPGEDGFSPVVTVTTITGGHRVTITDAQGAHTFDVMDGEDSGSVEEVFWAERDVTTEDEITTAVEAGKVVMCRDDTLTYNLTERLSVGEPPLRVRYWVFTAPTETGISMLTVTRSVWAVANAPYGETIQSVSWDAGSGRQQIVTDGGTYPINGTALFTFTATDPSVSFTTNATYANVSAALAAGCTPVGLLLLTVSNVLHAFPLTYSGEVSNQHEFFFERGWIGHRFFISSASGAQWEYQEYLPETADTIDQMSAAITALGNSKLDKNLGAANAGKFLVVGSDGNITAVTMTAWQGGSF